MYTTLCTVFLRPLLCWTIDLYTLHSSVLCTMTHRPTWRLLLPCSLSIRSQLRYHYQQTAPFCLFNGPGLGTAAGARVQLLRVSTLIATPTEKWVTALRPAQVQCSAGTVHMYHVKGCAFSSSKIPTWMYHYPPSQHVSHGPWPVASYSYSSTDFMVRENHPWPVQHTSSPGCLQILGIIVVILWIRASGGRQLDRVFGNADLLIRSFHVSHFDCGPGLRRRC